MLHLRDLTLLAIVPALVAAGALSLANRFRCGDISVCIQYDTCRDDFLLLGLKDPCFGNVVPIAGDLRNLTASTKWLAFITLDSTPFACYAKVWSVRDSKTIAM